MARDLGYENGPIAYWYRIPGSEEGTGYLPITTNQDAKDMIAFLPQSRILDIFIVCLGQRRSFAPWELDEYPDNVDDLIYMGHELIEDLEDDLEIVQADDEVIEEDNEFQESQLPEEVEDSNVGRAVVDKGKQKLIYIATETLNPKKKGKLRKYYTRFNGQGSSSHAAEAANPNFGSDSSSSEEDPDFHWFVDSENELLEEDDGVLFEENVDGDRKVVDEFADMGYAGHISDDGELSDGLASAKGSSDDSREDTGRFMVKNKKRFSKWPEFNKSFDMKLPNFQIGMAFANSDVFKRAMRRYAVLTKKELRFPKNTKEKVKVVCKTSPGCSFWVYAATQQGGTDPTMYIRTLKLDHQCSDIKGRVYHCHAPFIAEEYLDNFISDAKWSRAGIQAAVGRDFGMQVGYQMCYRAKRKAMKLCEGNFEEQYNLLQSYAAELKKRNPGTTVWIQTELEGDVAKFKRIYICFQALKIGWKAGCRRIICLDGCHLKGVHKGQLLTAVGVDGNNGMYPIAYAVVEQECKDSWLWFLENLRDDLEIYNSHGMVFMSDKQKGLELAILEVFEHADHRHCVRHLHNNFKGAGHKGMELKQIFWDCARSTTTHWFDRHMETMHNKSEPAWNWLSTRPARQWSKSHFDTATKSDMLLNNLCESFNASILEARRKPILPLLEDIRIGLMLRMANRRNSGSKWKGNVGPRIEKTIKKAAIRSHEYIALESSAMRFEIKGRGVRCVSGVISQHVVELDHRKCSCRSYDVSGLPCAHAIAAIYSKGLVPDDFVDVHYTKEKYLSAYEPVIEPITGVDEWEIFDRPIAPPLSRKLTGRPKLSRNKEPGEVPPPAGTTSLSKSYYSQIRCGICKQKGHNRRTCSRRSAPTSTQQRAVIGEVASEVREVDVNLNVNVQIPAIPDMNVQVFGPNVLPNAEEVSASQQVEASQVDEHIWSWI